MLGPKFALGQTNNVELEPIIISTVVITVFIYGRHEKDTWFVVRLVKYKCLSKPEIL